MSDASSLAPRRQSNWDWRAAANFICGGSAGGLLLWTAFASLGGVDLRGFVLAALGLIAMGLTCVWFELGRPWRALNVFRHGASSWMTREAVVAAVLFGFGTIAVASASQTLATAATGVLGLAFVYSQARILAANKGIPAWRHRGCLPLVMATGLAEGAGLLVAATLLVPAALTIAVALLIALAAIRLVAWRTYLLALQREGAPAGAIAALRAIDRPLLWVGSVAPALLALLAAAAASPVLAALAGFVVAVAGAGLKYTLVCRAAFVQGLALPKVPVRGAGRPAPGVKPGWERADQSLGNRA